MPEALKEKVKTPPYSLEAERSLLGAMLIDSESFDKVADIVSQQTFYQKE